jgi:hypothetical protein
MEDLSIDDPSNLSGMCHLIDNEGIKSGFNPRDLEAQIKDSSSLKRTNVAQSLENEIDKLTMSGSSEIDDLLRSLDAQPDTAPTSGSAPADREWGPPQQNYSGVNIQDPYLDYMTNEEKKQNVIGEVFNDIQEENGSTPIFSIEKEKEEDEKARKLESISFLRETLEDEGESLERIPVVNHTNSLQEIDAVYRLLILKNDRKRCCGFAEECILMGAHGVEWVFNGERNYMGYKPDMTDWHKSVQGKLRRMRHDTSNVVGNIMSSYNLGSGMRILLELIPSMFLYSRMRKNQRKDSLVSDEEFNVGISNLRDYEKK